MAASKLNLNPKVRNEFNARNINGQDPFNDFDPMGKHYYSDRRNHGLTPEDDSYLFADEERRLDTRTPKLYVTHFHDYITEERLRKIFGAYGEILHVFKRKSENGENFAFITYGQIDHALAAIHGLHLRSPYRLHVRFAREKKSNQEVALNPIVDPEIPNISKLEYNEPKLPLVLSNARENFLNSDIFKRRKGTTRDCYNRFITKVAKNQRKYGRNEIFMKNKLIVEMSEDESED